MAQWFNHFCAHNFLDVDRIALSSSVGQVVGVHLAPIGTPLSLSSEQVLAVSFPAFKISMYYATLQVLAYAIGLYLKRFYVLIYLLPLLLNVSLALAFPRNSPSSLAFIDDFLSFDAPAYYYVFVGVLFGLASLTVIPRCWKKNEL